MNVVPYKDMNWQKKIIKRKLTNLILILILWSDT